MIASNLELLLDLIVFPLNIPFACSPDIEKEPQDSAADRLFRKILRLKSHLPAFQVVYHAHTENGTVDVDSIENDLIEAVIGTRSEQN